MAEGRKLYLEWQFRPNFQKLTVYEKYFSFQQISFDPMPFYPNHGDAYTQKYGLYNERGLGFCPLTASRPYTAFMNNVAFHGSIHFCR